MPNVHTQAKSKAEQTYTLTLGGARSQTWYTLNFAKPLGLVTGVFKKVISHLILNICWWALKTHTWSWVLMLSHSMMFSHSTTMFKVLADRFQQHKNNHLVWMKIKFPAVTGWERTMIGSAV
jgi:hypothetical protein